MIKEGKQLWGYDNKFDKFIFADMTKGMDIGISTVWFTSKNICVVISINYISNPEKAPYKMEVEFKSPDIFLLKTMVSNNIVETITFSRVKN